MNEEKTTSAGEYKQKFAKVKVVDVPSGAKFKIRALTPLDFWDSPDLAGITDATTMSNKSNLAAVKVFLTKCVLEPKIYEKSDKKEDLLLSDICMEDSLALSNEIGKLSSGGDLNFLAKGQGVSPSTPSPKGTAKDPVK